MSKAPALVPLQVEHINADTQGRYPIVILDKKLIKRQNLLFVQLIIQSSDSIQPTLEDATHIQDKSPHFSLDDKGS